VLIQQVEQTAVASGTPCLNSQLNNSMAPLASKFRTLEM